MKRIKSINTGFDDIILAIRHKYAPYIIEWTETDIQMDGERISDELPTVWFGIADTPDHAVTGYNADVNILRIDMTRHADSFSELIRSNNLSGLADFLMKFKSVFVHELSHHLDHMNPGDQRAFLKNYKHERTSRLSNIWLQLTEPLAPDEVDYFNNKTEINAYLIQHIWSVIDTMISTRHPMSFNQFCESIKSSRFYQHLMPEGRKRVLKRMYYVWDAIYRQMPTIKELDEHSYEQLRELFRTTNPTKRIRTNTDPVMESRSQIAADIIDGLVVDPYAIRSSVSKRWNIRVDTTARDLFLDGFM